jgi:hypothetical protein
MKLSDGSIVYFSFVNLKGIDNKYRHPSIRFVVAYPDRVQDTDQDMYGNIIMEFQYQSNGSEPTNDWYGGSISGLTSVSDFYNLRDITRILKAWERYLDSLPWDKYLTHKRKILGFLKKKKIKRVVPTPDRYSQWTLYSNFASEYIRP